ncbi:hypothetical protein [Cryobacterium ruanii]|uniref:Uncharacterized protein n=1 Tax=Cryobacterium ruanii TaxID=1259197 RepID=A0A4R9APA5_9MICO|nr:hypothetical protein [Cryobacterium ruanii]TFD66920.1 hypothetical protein E3T47_07095 [Cryobacterium ruanii]
MTLTAPTVAADSLPECDGYRVSVIAQAGALLAMALSGVRFGNGRRNRVEFITQLAGIFGRDAKRRLKLGDTTVKRTLVASSTTEHYCAGSTSTALKQVAGIFESSLEDPKYMARRCGTPPRAGDPPTSTAPTPPAPAPAPAPNRTGAWG